MNEGTSGGTGGRRWKLAIGAAVALLLVGFWLGRATRAGGGREAAPPMAAAAETGSERLYTCSMHPQVRSRDPKEKCPLCGMDLIPVPGDDQGEGEAGLPRLTLSPRALALAQVETTPVQRRAVRTAVEVYGAVAVDQTRLYHVTAWVSGRLEKLHVNQTGVAVQAGQPLVEIYSPILVAAQEELLQVQGAWTRLPESAAPSHRAGAEALLAAARDKLRLLGMTAEQVEALQTRGTLQDRVTLVSPAEGVVLEREATEGMVVERGERLFTVADLGRVWVQLEVHERDLAWVRPGVAVRIVAAGLPGEHLDGRVALVEPVVEESRRTVGVRVEAANPGRRLKPGMFVTARLFPPTETGEELVIPLSAALITGRRAVVYVQPDPQEPTFDAREVVLGPRAGEEVVVREGLKAGELVVVRGNFKIDSELQIRGRPSMMAASGQPPAPSPVHQPASSETSRAGDPAGAGAGQPTARLPLGELVEGNFRLVKALSDDDAAAAGVASRELLGALARLDQGVPEGMVADLWRPLAARLRSGLEGLAAERELEAMRRHFEVFSDALTEAVRRFGPGTEKPVYRAVCPMVQGRRAYWLQADRPITNPFHGARMYSCGEISETIATGTPAGVREVRP